MTPRTVHIFRLLYFFGILGVLAVQDCFIIYGKIDESREYTAPPGICTLEDCPKILNFYWNNKEDYYLYNPILCHNSTSKIAPCSQYVYGILKYDDNFLQFIGGLYPGSPQSWELQEKLFYKHNADWIAIGCN